MDRQISPSRKGEQCCKGTRRLNLSDCESFFLEMPGNVQSCWLFLSLMMMVSTKNKDWIKRTNHGKTLCWIRFLKEKNKHDVLAFWQLAPPTSHGVPSRPWLELQTVSAMPPEKGVCSPFGTGSST